MMMTITKEYFSIYETYRITDEDSRDEEWLLDNLCGGQLGVGAKVVFTFQAKSLIEEAGGSLR